MSASLDLKSKEEKDAELDKRIEALRRKNQALIKRYQEIEEDRKKAEQEGIAVTGGRRPRSGEGEALERRHGGLDSPTLTVQVSLSSEEKRVVSTERRHVPPAKASRAGSGARSTTRGGPRVTPHSPRGEGLPEQPSWEEAGPEGPGGAKRGRGGRGRRPRARGGPAGDTGPDRRSKEWEERRRQNIEKMNEEMEKIAEYERSQRQDGLQEKNPVRNFLDDPRRSGSFAESDRREGSRRHMRNWGGPDFDKVKTGMEQGKEWGGPARGSAQRRGGGGGGGGGGSSSRGGGGGGGHAALDMTLSMTGRERAEYIRWKQEREQIDRERLARHRQPTGEWRREWDAEKVDAPFKEGSKQGSSASGKQESKRPPKLPTFGEYLSEQPTDRRRKGRSRGRPRSGPSKPYSMHDNRWEKEEPETVLPRVEDQLAPSPVEQAEPPASPSVTLEEEEDQWEDVSGGEEEEEEEEGEGGEEALEAKSRGSQDPKEGEQPHSASSPLPPRSNGQLSLVMPPGQPETPATEGKPLTPFSPTDGYHPVSDWGEEMDLSSPRADATKSPLAGLGDVSPSSAGTASPKASRGPEEEGAAPTAQAPQAQTSTEPEVAKREAGLVAEDPGQQGAETEASPAPAPSGVEIADSQQEQLEA